MPRSGSVREKALRPDGGSLLLRVWAHPGSDRDAIDGIDPFRNAIVVRVRDRAVEGEANAGIISLIAGRLGCPVALEAGSTSRLKLLRAWTGMSPEEASTRLFGTFQ